MFKKILGDSVRHHRKDKGLTQEQLALESGLAYRFLQDLESGNKQPSISTIFKLCAALDTTPEALTKTAWKYWLENTEDPLF